ncbi:XTP/dITP diphosphatase [Halanaerobaculum tunisiense]
MRLFLATGNDHKIKEVIEMLADTDIEVVSKYDFSQVPEVVEDATTFRGNALKKARELCNYTGLSTIADDSGLVVEALDGQPGVYSARFAGSEASDQANNQKLLRLLKDTPQSQRDAYFTCAIALVTSEEREEVVTGKCEGRIASGPQGRAGFGYDPLFIPAGYQKSFAQLGSQVKNQISHRAKALDKMKQILVEM